MASVQDLIALEQVGNKAVDKLRLQKLNNGIPFMINSDELKVNECYLEYPDGHVSIVTLAANLRDFIVIKDLTSAEANALRKKYNFNNLNA